MQEPFAQRHYTKGTFHPKSSTIEVTETTNTKQLTQINNNPIEETIPENKKETTATQYVIKNNTVANNTVTASTAPNKNNSTANIANKQIAKEKTSTYTTPIYFKNQQSKHSAKAGNIEQQESAKGSNVPLILLVILAIFIPALAVFLYEGVTTNFWISLILMLLVVSWLIGSIFALLVIFGVLSFN